VKGENNMLERNNPKTLYQQLRDILIQEIDSGKWEPNERIPSENELSVQYGLSRMTVRAVLSDLVKEGLLYRVQGKGTYASERVLTLRPSYVGIREQLEEMGYEVTTKILEYRVVESSRKVANNLNLEPGEPVLMIKRIRYIKDEPISLHISYVSKKYSQKISRDLMEKEQLCVILNKEYGLVRKKVSETLESVPAQEEETVLGVQQGHPLLLLSDIIYDESETPYEFTKVLFRGDKVKIKLQFE